MPIARVLLVDEDELVRFHIAKILEDNGFEISSASSAPEALSAMTTNEYDVLLSDLQNSRGINGLTVVSAMRHANPRAVAILMSGFNSIDAAADAVLFQADEMLVRPFDSSSLVDIIHQRLKVSKAFSRKVETTATILERNAEPIIQAWNAMVLADDLLGMVPLTYGERAGHLSQVMRDLVTRLRSSEQLGSKAFESPGAKRHGAIRAQQGYTAPMMVEESRLLQVSVYRTLQENLATIDFSVVLADVMTIADEVDSLLRQTMEAFLKSPT